MRILHVNVRLNEGGAARVALDLHRRLLARSIESKIFYGYGPGGKKSPHEDLVPHAHQAGHRVQVVSNYFAHKAIGVDPFKPSGRRASALKLAINEADIVHLHVIHSHSLPYAWLIGQLRSGRKKVVWTLHDSWVLTGRCAITDTCERWRGGCGHCPQMGNYPSALLDMSASEHWRKRRQIDSLGSDLVFVGCSRWIAQRAEIAFPRHTVHLINNGLDAQMEECLMVPTTHGNERTTVMKRLLIVGADLSDPKKQDIELLRRVIALDGYSVQTVGRNSPFSGANVVNHGPVTSRVRLTEIYREADATLFTSKVDIFSLVIVESLTAGTPVMALNSPGSREVLGLVGATPFGSEDEMLIAIQRGSFFRNYKQRTREELHREALKVYSGEKVTRQYIDLYESLMNHVCL